MSDPSGPNTHLPSEQQAIRAKCFHPTGTFVEFKQEEVEQSIPQRFEKIVSLYPQRLAVKAGGQGFTYAALNERANRIARAILAMRGQSREPIALLFEHGADVISAIFGGLKAGKSNVVLDPSFPPARNEYLLGNSNASLVVTNSKNLNLARQLVKQPACLLNIDEMADSLPSDDLGIPLSPYELGIITYTSGSTGDPKGVMKSHLDLLYSFFVQVNVMQISTEDRISLCHSLSFAASYTNLVTALLSGASIFPFDIKSQGIQGMAKWLREEEITVCHLPPAVFRQLGESLYGKDKLHHLRLIRLSGALITPKDFELYKNHFSSTTLLMISMGSTESRGICSAILDHTFSFPTDGAPLGYPVPGKEILLLGEDGREVERGETGEIAVRSRRASAGYWRQPELTETKFISDPKGGDEQIYLTGDLGRMLPDGFLIYLGRKDLVVKIRGYRVSFNEIERALSEHPSVKESAVVAWDDNGGDKWLAAYVVSRTEPSPSGTELMSFLKDRLPHYMVPSVFVVVKSLPQINGKVDRPSLPRPQSFRPDLAQPYMPAGTAIEEQLIQIWEEVLSVHPIGIHDDFFELGGHSLAATRVVSQVIKKFQLELPLQSLFQSPTVAAMAAIITEHRGKKLGQKEMETLLTELEALTEEEAQRLLANENNVWLRKD